MKKTLIFSTLLVLLTSCDQKEPTPDLIQTDAQICDLSTPRLRTLDEAVACAESAMDLLPEAESRSMQRIVRKENVKIVGSVNSRSGDTDTLMYVFNFDDDQGFVVVAADKQKENSVIALSEQGSYNPDETTDNIGLTDYMARATEYLEKLRSTPQKIPEGLTPIDPNNPFNPDLLKYKIGEDTLEIHRYVPNFNLRWGQQNPEGWLCPNGFCGCANLALGMAMTYVKKSVIKIADIATGDSISFYPQILKRHHQSYASSDDLFKLESDGCELKNPGLHNTIAKLMWLIGQHTKSDYSSSFGTGTDYESFIESLPSLTLKTYRPTWAELTNELACFQDNGVCIMWGGISETLAHAYLIDGYYEAEVQKGEWIQRGMLPWELINDLGKYTISLHHINWGLNGDGNGWYNLSIYSPSASKLDDDNPEGNPHFKFTKVIFIPIYDCDAQLTHPTLKNIFITN